MSTITVNIDNELKKKAQEKAKREGTTLTFIVSHFFKSYTDGQIEFELIQKEKDDNEITASFDVSTEEGKQKCLESFRSLCK